MSLTAISIGLGAFSSVYNRNAQKSANKISKAQMKELTKYKKDISKSREENDQETLKYNYRQNVLANNMMYVESTRAISQSAHKANEQIAISSAIGGAYNANQSSAFADSQSQLNTEYEQALLSTELRVTQDFKNNQKVNIETKMNIAKNAEMERFQLSLEEMQFNQSLNAKESAAKTSMIGGLAGSAIKIGYEFSSFDNLEGESFSRSGNDFSQGYNSTLNLNYKWY